MNQTPTVEPNIETEFRFDDDPQDENDVNDEPMHEGVVGNELIQDGVPGPLTITSWEDGRDRRIQSLNHLLTGLRSFIQTAPTSELQINSTSTVLYQLRRTINHFSTREVRLLLIKCF